MWGTRHSGLPGLFKALGQGFKWIDFLRIDLDIEGYRGLFLAPNHLVGKASESGALYSARPGISKCDDELSRRGVSKNGLSLNF